MIVMATSVELMKKKTTIDETLNEMKVEKTLKMLKILHTLQAQAKQCQKLQKMDKKARPGMPKPSQKRSTHSKRQSSGRPLSSSIRTGQTRSTRMSSNW